MENYFSKFAFYSFSLISVVVGQIGSRFMGNVVICIVNSRTALNPLLVGNYVWLHSRVSRTELDPLKSGTRFELSSKYKQCVQVQNSFEWMIHGSNWLIPQDAVSSVYTQSRSCIVYQLSTCISIQNFSFTFQYWISLSWTLIIQSKLETKWTIWISFKVSDNFLKNDCCDNWLGLLLLGQESQGILSKLVEKFEIDADEMLTISGL